MRDGIQGGRLSALEEINPTHTGNEKASRENCLAGGEFYPSAAIIDVCGQNVGTVELQLGAGTIRGNHHDSWRSHFVSADHVMQNVCLVRVRDSFGIDKVQALRRTIR